MSKQKFVEEVAEFLGVKIGEEFEARNRTGESLAVRFSNLGVHRKFGGVWLSEPDPYTLGELVMGMRTVVKKPKPIDPDTIRQMYMEAINENPSVGSAEFERIFAVAMVLGRLLGYSTEQIKHDMGFGDRD